MIKISQENEKQNTPATPIQQQIGLLNLRINDMMTQLNTAMKTILEENQALKKENTELKEKTINPK